MDRPFRQSTLFKIPRSFVLAYDIKDLKGNLLAQKGELFSSRLLKKITRSSPPFKPGTLLRDLPIFKKDLVKAQSEIPFRSSYYLEFSKNGLQKVLLETRLPLWVIETLEYFKKRDPDTYWHSLRVFILAAFMSLKFVKPHQSKVLVASMGPLHDVGKIAVPLSILQKKSPLTLEERNQLQFHVLAGAVLHAYYQGMINPLGIKVALEHHERLDRSGYPFGIRLSDPTVEIIALCDVYDALISSRPYRNRPYEIRAALELITQMGIDGTFSIDLVRFLIGLHRKGRVDFKKLVISKEKRGQPPEVSCYGKVLSPGKQRKSIS